MNPITELRLHADALATAVKANPKFFASVVHYVERFRDLLRGPAELVARDELSVLAAKLDEFWSKWRPSGGDGLYFPPRDTADTDGTVQQIGVLVNRLVSMDEEAFAQSSRSSRLTGEIESRREDTSVAQPCVFLGHGGSRLWARVKMFLEDELGLATVTYESEPRVGESIVPVLERMLGQATFAVVVLTAEDDAPDGAKRARQNVVHEAGLFQGRLGFKRAVLLVQEGVDAFSNVAGLQHIPFSGDKIEQAFYELQRVLKREGQLASPGTGP